jgi:hypothetical protein
MLSSCVLQWRATSRMPSCSGFLQSWASGFEASRGNWTPE